MSHAGAVALLIAAAGRLAAADGAAPLIPLAPRTALGRVLALALVVLVGALVAGSVAIVAAEVRRMARLARARSAHTACGACGATRHQGDAVYCRHCGTQLAGGAGRVVTCAPTCPPAVVLLLALAGGAADGAPIYGGMLAFRVRGGRAEALAMAGRLRLVTRATSLGGTESLIEHRASVEGPHTRAPESLLRLSVGLEHPDDVIADLAQPLDGGPDGV